MLSVFVEERWHNSKNADVENNSNKDFRICPKRKLAYLKMSHFVITKHKHL